MPAKRVHQGVAPAPIVHASAPPRTIAKTCCAIPCFRYLCCSCYITPNASCISLLHLCSSHVASTLKRAHLRTPVPLYCRDQAIYRQDLTAPAAPVLVTRGSAERGERFAEYGWDEARGRLVGVCEVHPPGAAEGDAKDVVNCIVAVGERRAGGYAKGRVRCPRRSVPPDTGLAHVPKVYTVTHSWSNVILCL